MFVPLILKLVLELLTAADNFFSVYFSDTLSYNMCIYHTLASRRNAHDVRLRWMFSSNLKFQTLNQTEGPNLSVQVYFSYVDIEVRK